MAGEPPANGAPGKEPQADRPQSGGRAAPSRAALAEGDAVIFVDRKNRHYLRVLSRGVDLAVRGGRIKCDVLIGNPEGSVAESSHGEKFRVVRPSYAHLVPCLPRQAQVIYPKDAGQILINGDIYPGATVVEVGVGPGALTIALLRGVGPRGEVISYEIREDFCALARKNVSLFCRETPNWRLVTADACAGIGEREVDRLVADMPEPWRLVEPAAECLRPGGVFVSFVPTVLQLKTIVDALNFHPLFDLVEAMESFNRFWHVHKLSVRPQHRMIAHTGFIITARRVV